MSNRPRDKLAPHLDPGPSWRELQPCARWSLRTFFGLTGVITCFCAGWVHSDFRVTLVGVGVVTLVCVLLRDRFLAAMIAVGAGCPAVVLILLQWAIESIEIAPP